MGGRPDPGSTAEVVPLVSTWRMDRTFTYVIPEGLEGLKVGALVRVPLGSRRVRGVVVAIDEAPNTPDLAAILGVVGPAPVAPSPMPALLRWVAIRYAVPLPVALDKVVPPRVRVIPAVPPVRLPHSTGIVASYPGGTELLDAIATSREQTFVLRPVGDADRVPLMEDLLAALPERSALVAVPEVRFGSPVLERLAGAGFVRLDSGVDDPERSAGWFGLAQGARLGAGARATVLAPSRDLGLIVVDEEHDPSYKEDRAPRYDARRVAVQRASATGAVCVLISPTPTLEASFQVRRGNFHEATAPRAAHKAARPVIELVEAPGDRVLSSQLHERVRDVLRAGDRVALLSPQRGYARTLWCAACRRSLRCPRCETGLFYDRRPARMRCGRCGYGGPAPATCPHCGEADLRYLGAGSERLAEQLQKAFPRALVRRVDPDTIGAGDARDGSDRPIVYLTTWIGTKPALRPDVKLVGVLDADALIRRPDWRAAERAYHALAEMASWAGPARSGGRLVIQTSDPGHHAVQAVVRADYDFWLERELAARKELSYPPFSELVKVASWGPAARDQIDAALAALRGCDATILGPIETDVRTARDTAPQAGLEVLVKAASATEVAEALRGILSDVPRGTRLRVDVDPR